MNYPYNRKFYIDYKELQINNRELIQYHQPFLLDVVCYHPILNIDFICLKRNKCHNRVVEIIKEELGIDIDYYFPEEKSYLLSYD